jgi:hypothetical protein
VYGLVSTKDEQAIRYVGVTKYDAPDIRLSKHHEHAVYSDINRPVYDWMRKHLRLGYSIKAIVLVRLDNCKDLALIEKQIIKDYRSKGANLLNSTDGGEGVTGYTHSEESRQKMKDAWSKRKNKNKSSQQQLSEKTKRKISEKMTGRKQSEEHTRKIVESRRQNKQRQKESK